MWLWKRIKAPIGTAWPGQRTNRSLLPTLPARGRHRETVRCITLEPDKFDSMQWKRRKTQVHQIKSLNHTITTECISYYVQNNMLQQVSLVFLRNYGI
eukprot:1992393-Amphidinium_carterae.1